MAALALLLPATATTQAEDTASGFNGVWVFDEGASDNTDRQVEKAIKASGGKPIKGKSGNEKYRGGPPEQELYDALSYDRMLQISIAGPEVRMRYPNDLERVFYTDNRPRSVSAVESAVKDYSFATLQGNRMLVESRPRDGGRIHEEYDLLDGGKRLRITMQLLPSNFGETVEIRRVFNRYEEVKSEK